MKIRKIAIKNYKIFDDLKLDFTDENGRTKNVIVLAGLNGTGKTTVLEIINKFFNNGTFENVGKDFEIVIEVDFSEIEKIEDFLRGASFKFWELVSNKNPSIVAFKWTSRSLGHTARHFYPTQLITYM